MKGRRQMMGRRKNKFEFKERNEKDKKGEIGKKRKLYALTEIFRIKSG